MIEGLRTNYMCRIAFVILILASLPLFSPAGLYAQESRSESKSEPVTVGVNPEQMTGHETISKPKTSPSLLEEFFSSPLNYFLVLVVCLYVYLMFVQPRGVRQEKKLQLQRLNNLKKNDRVVTSAGIHGIVSNINVDAGTVTLRVDESSNTKLTIDRDSIRSVAS